MASPARRTTSTRWTDGAAATASSATAFSGDPRPAAEEAVRGDEHRRLAVGEPGRHGGRPVPAEDRRVDRLQPAERQHRDHGLDEHRQQDPDPVARLDAVRPEPSRRGVDRRDELRVGQPADLAVLALPDERLAVRVARGARLGRGPGVVEGAAAPPARPCRAVGQVEDLRRPAVPGDPDVVGRGAPEPAGIGGGARLQRLERRLAGRPQEPGQPGRLGDLRGRPPRDPVPVAPEDRHRHGPSGRARPGRPR